MPRRNPDQLKAWTCEITHPISLKNIVKGIWGSLPDAASGPVGGGGLQETPEEEPRGGHCQLKVQCVQHTVLHPQDVLPGVGVVCDVAEFLHLNSTHASSITA